MGVYGDTGGTGAGRCGWVTVSWDHNVGTKDMQITTAHHFTRVRAVKYVRNLFILRRDWFICRTGLPGSHHGQRLPYGVFHFEQRVSIEQLAQRLLCLLAVESQHNQCGQCLVHSFLVTLTGNKSCIN